MGTADNDQNEKEQMKNVGCTPAGRRWSQGAENRNDPVIRVLLIGRGLWYTMSRLCTWTLDRAAAGDMSVGTEGNRSGALDTRLAEREDDGGQQNVSKISV